MGNLEDSVRTSIKCRVNTHPYFILKNPQEKYLTPVFFNAIVISRLLKKSAFPEDLQGQLK